MDAILLLCDYAEAINGKLYIMGGGWTSCPPGPRLMAVAIRVNVPWSETNLKHQLALFLQDADGNQVELGEPPQPVKKTADFEVGRPPGIPQGTELDFTAVFGFVNLLLQPDTGYRWQLEINGDPSGHASFRTRPG
ncbi:MAG: hypothetical protein V1748_13075 [Actinomycetota bacterium]